MKERFRLFCGVITSLAPIWQVCFLLLFLLWEFSLRSQVAISLPIAPISGVSNGELWRGELNCVACHQADTTVKTRLFSRQSPRLDEGLNLTPQYLRAFLTNPSAEKPGTTMPDVLYSMDSERKAETVDALIHFLRSLMKTNASVATSANQVQMTEGRLLYHQIGCVACHAPQEPTGAPKAEGLGEPFARAVFTNSVPLGNLAKKFTVDDLAGFLMNPLKARPGGRMPSMNLSEGQATALSIYLLREQTGATNASRPSVRIKGLDYEYFEGHFTETAELDRVKPTATGTIERFSISPRKRTEYFGFRFTGWISVPADGAYSFYVASDDGSRLYVNEKLVVENDGHHATTEKRGTIQLPAGAYPIRVSYFNADGALELKVSYEGPGLPKQQIPPTALSHLGLPMVPLEEETLAVTPEKALRGKELFASLGCATCHQPGSTILAARISKPSAA